MTVQSKLRDEGKGAEHRCPVRPRIGLDADDAGVAAFTRGERVLDDLAPVQILDVSGLVHFGIEELSAVRVDGGDHADLPERLIHDEVPNPIKIDLRGEHCARSAEPGLERQNHGREPGIGLPLVVDGRDREPIGYRHPRRPP